MVHWYKRDPHAAIEGMLGLTLEERGAYNTLLDMLYARDGSVPNDDQFMAVAQQCDVRVWRRVRDRLIAWGKIWITADGNLMAKGVEVRLNEVISFAEVQKIRAKNRWKSTKNEKFGNANTSTSTSIESLLPFSLTPSEHLQPSQELLKVERKKRPTPGSLATALVDSALASPAIAPTVPSKGDRLDRPFTRAEIGKPNGWDFHKEVATDETEAEIQF